LWKTFTAKLSANVFVQFYSKMSYITSSSSLHLDVTVKGNMCGAEDERNASGMILLHYFYPNLRYCKLWWLITNYWEQYYSTCLEKCAYYVRNKIYCGCHKGKKKKIEYKFNFLMRLGCYLYYIVLLFVITSDFIINVLNKSHAKIN